jgi:hypothetical protein
MTKEKFNYMLEACKDTLDNCKEGLMELFDKGNCHLDITFQFRLGEVVIMNVSSDYNVRKNDVNETTVINLGKQELK